MDDKTKASQEATQGPAKKLGLSKLVYGLGMSARDALVAFVVSTAALTPIMRYGRDKSKIIDTISKVPEKLHSMWTEKAGKNAGKWGTALVAAAGLGTLISYVAHIPGLVRGPQRIREAQDQYNTEVQANIELAKENAALTERLKHQAIELETGEKSGSFVERLAPVSAPAPAAAIQAAEDPAKPAAKAQGPFTAKLQNAPAEGNLQARA